MRWDERSSTTLPGLLLPVSSAQSMQTQNLDTNQVSVLFAGVVLPCFAPLQHLLTQILFFLTHFAPKRTCCCFHTRPSTLPLWHAYAFSTPVLLPYVSSFHLIMCAGPYFSPSSFPPPGEEDTVWYHHVCTGGEEIQWRHRCLSCADGLTGPLQIRVQRLLTWLRVISQSLGIDAAVIAQKIHK